MVRAVGEGGRILRGRWPDPCRTVRGRRGGGSAVSPSRRPWRGRRAGRWAGAPGGDPADRPDRGVPLAPNPRRILAGSFRDPSGILPGSWPDPSGTVRGRFEDDSRTVRGRFEGVWAAKAPSDHAGDPGEGARRLPWPPGRAAASRWSVGPVCLHGFMANPFLGVHLNPTRQRAGPSQVHRLHQLPARWRRHRSTHETTI
jgi:hypothetical protein